MPIATVNGVRLWHDQMGKGPPLVLVMGYRLSAAAWPERWLELMASRFRLLLIDNRGTGLSGKPTEGYAIGNLARDVVGLMDHVGIGTADLLGYSMGGAIAQELVLANPGRVRRLVLCATFCGRPHAVSSAPDVVTRLRDHAGRSPETIARNMWEITYSPAHLAANGAAVEAQMRRELVHPTPLHTGDLQFQALASFDSYDRLGAIVAPTLVLTGSADRLVPPANSRILAERIPAARLSILEGCGHRLLWEAPEETAELIADFLETSRERAHA